MQTIHPRLGTPNLKITALHEIAGATTFRDDRAQLITTPTDNQTCPFVSDTLRKAAVMSAGLCALVARVDRRRFELLSQ